MGGMERKDMAKAKVATAKETELNRWCIEMALRWPTMTSYGAAGGAVGAYGGGTLSQTVDCDVIGRANKIMAWVKESH
jgi:hypothetical protein